jgi:chromosome partitioning protein
MKVISVVNTKGGTGKSTVAVNIATLLASKGHEVLLIDTDAKQNSSLSFCQIRNANPDLANLAAFSLPVKSLFKDIKKFSNFDFIVIDAGAGDNELVRAAILCSGFGMLIVPVQPSTYDFWATEDTLKILNDLRESFEGYDKNYILINRKSTNNRMRILKDTEESLKDVCDKFDVKVLHSELSDRVAFKEAVGAGKNVVEYAVNNKSGKKAAAELTNLVVEIKNILEH